jgi:hypothetical protein
MTSSLTVLALALLAQAGEPPKTYADWQSLVEFECNGPWLNLAEPEVKTAGKFRYELKGATAKVRRLEERKPGPVKLGLLAGIKDVDDETRAALKLFIAAFEAADVEAILVGGDTGEQPAQLDAVYEFLVQLTARPLLSITGNTERAGSHNFAISKQRKAGHHQLTNLGQVRRYDGDGFDVVSLSGYHDRTFLHLSGGCIYDQLALDGAEQALKAADDPVVLLVHGPPQQRGKLSLDQVPGVGNVGDPQLTALISKYKIPFGVFGHILEAGARGTDLAGKPLPQKKLHKALYVNQGSANALPWKLNDGTTSYGIAALLTIDGKQGSYEVLRAPKPAPSPAGE